MNKFDLSKCERNEQGHYLCQTESGLSARIVCTNCVRCVHPWLVLVKEPDQREVHYYYQEGGQFTGQFSHPYDLINIPKTFRLERWRNIYPIDENFRFANVVEYATKELADMNAQSDRIACVPVIIEGKEGDGL